MCRFEVWITITTTNETKQTRIIQRIIVRFIVGYDNFLKRAMGVLVIVLNLKFETKISFWKRNKLPLFSYHLFDCNYVIMEKFINNQDEEYYESRGLNYFRTLILGFLIMRGVQGKVNLCRALKDNINSVTELAKGVW